MPSDRPQETGLPIAGPIGAGPAMEIVYRLVRQVARSKASVLLLGERGTGKELIARAIHRLGPRADSPFVRVHCGEFTATLLESELFGHVHGAFTGAIADRVGRFEAAHTGTIFLDEIDAMPPMLQIKLLRVLQDGEFERIGESHTTPVDVRIVTASNCDLLEETVAGRFREDLYYRLSVVTIHMPPLRERREDIPALVEHFLRAYNEPDGRQPLRVASEAMRAMQEYLWPGNVRELQNCLEHAAVLATGDELTLDLLPETLRGGRLRRVGGIADAETLAAELVRQGIETAGPTAENLHAAVVNRVERELIVQVLAACNNIRTQAADRLGINRNTLHKKLKEYGLEK